MKLLDFKNTIVFILSLLLFSTSLPLQGKEINFKTLRGENILLDVQTEDTFFGVMEKLIDAFSPCEECNFQLIQGQLLFETEALQGAPENGGIHLALSNQSFIPSIIAARYTPPGVRNYEAELTPAEQANIRTIIMTLATVPVATLIFYQGDLEKAGDLIDHVHPLKFLEYVFSNDELRANVGSIKPKGSWVWGEFINNLGDSLNQETDYQNMKDAFIYSFAAKVKVDPALIFPYIRQRQWERFVEILISKVPRAGNPTRYNS